MFRPTELSAPTTRLAVVLAMLAGGCAANMYDFRKAQSPDGKVDLSQLISDLEKEPGGRLEYRFWIPLVKREEKSFESYPRKNEPAIENPGTPSDRPEGYRLEVSSMWGPFFAYVKRHTAYYDKSATAYEVDDTRTYLWRFWTRHRTVVETDYGTRIEARNVGLFGLLPPFIEKVEHPRKRTRGQEDPSVE